MPKSKLPESTLRALRYDAGGIPRRRSHCFPGVFPRNRGYGVANIFHLGSGHSRINRERYETRPLAGRHREMLGKVLEIPAVVGMQMQGHPVDGAGYTTHLHLIDELGPIDIQLVQAQPD